MGLNAVLCLDEPDFNGVPSSGEGLFDLLRAKQALIDAGDVGLSAEEFARIESPSGNVSIAGFTARALRQNGVLVQCRGDGGYFVVESVALTLGAWMHHAAFGVVKVAYERAGFSHVEVRCLDGSVHKVKREELDGQSDQGEPRRVQRHILNPKPRAEPASE